MSNVNLFSPKTLPKDFLSSIVVFLVALPLCLGVAVACGVDPIAGILAGIVGGILVGTVSGSHTSVSGPAAGLIAIVIAQVDKVGIQGFAVAVFLAGIIQIGMGVFKLGNLAKFFPISVIKGLLAAIGIILILKQIPHLFGHDTDPEGEMAFQQPDGENTFSELWATLGDLHWGALAVGLLSLAFLLLWGRIKFLRESGVPAPLVAVVFGVLVSLGLAQLGEKWVIGEDHLVRVPIVESPVDLITSDQPREKTLRGIIDEEEAGENDIEQTPTTTGEEEGDKGNDEQPKEQLLRVPSAKHIPGMLVDFQIWLAAITIALVASLETLLNLEAVDNLDPKQRNSPPNRELVAQGVGNLAAGSIGALPVTSVIIRSSVNIHSGGQTKISAISHGVLLLLCVLFLPWLLNMIPLSVLAAILILTGFKLASPTVMKQMWAGGRYQFIPFVVTILAIMGIDLLYGVLIGLVVAMSFILNSNLRRPIRQFVEKHVGGDITRIELAEQVSFFKRAPLTEVLDNIPRGGHVLLDASKTDYIDPDVLNLIREYKEKTGPARDVQVSLQGFRNKYEMADHIQFVDFATRELQEAITPAQVLEVLKAGHQRFLSGERINRNFSRHVGATADAQHPLAVVLSCIDSRAPVELIFDAGLGDLFTVRVAGNVTSEKVLGSIEYGCAVAGAKLILVMGHTRCGAVTAAVDTAVAGRGVAPGDCLHIDPILNEISESIDDRQARELASDQGVEKEAFVNMVARENVHHVVRRVTEQSPAIAKMVESGEVAIVGALYDVVSGELEFFSELTLDESDRVGPVVEV